MSISNKIMVLLFFYLRILVLLFPVLILFYFEYHWLFALSMIIFCVSSIELFFSVRYIKIKVSSDKISVKELKLFKVDPVRFLKVASDEVSEFYIEDKLHTMSFHLELHARIKVINFSTKYFTQNQKTKLTHTVTRYISNYNGEFEKGK